MVEYQLAQLETVSVIVLLAIRDLTAKLSLHVKSMEVIARTQEQLNLSQTNVAAAVLRVSVA